ncbi:E3 ubiquitin-protein ligase SHPRH-like isoform X1 [Lucilia sericata]|uniref:E3 ubiquitin-protein ligase SHPRH-like isoform X1 n=1 Tax=Lucilia sericata TaxID=13632 RepID=UPI0018A8788B|nr:E3 ubiquitin-protein ligase SHPRH-like isoform X1 [Lucilia sericata]
MSDQIILTKIAKLANTQEISCDNKNVTFECKGKKWLLLDGYKDDAKNIFQLIQKCGQHRPKDFGFASTYDGYFVVVYRNIIRHKKDDFFDRLTEELLDTVYPYLKKHASSSSVRENKVLKTYVTTRLFEALQLKHTEVMRQDLTNAAQRSLSLPSRFLPTLCEYQKKSILWLLKRELDQESFPDFFEKLTAKDNETTVYKHLYSRYILADPPDDLVLPPGGILADEMGLGKTVEMLALILLNSCLEINLSPRMETFFSNTMAKRKCLDYKLFCICNSNSKLNTIQCQKCQLWQHQDCVNFFASDMDNEEVNTPYLCPSCWQLAVKEYGLLKTKATFIVSPNTIKMQWASEIKRHIQPTLKVFIYEGVLSGKWISPRQLADYDIVLTDYNILRGDVYFTQDNVSERSTRNKPRSMRANTPILMLDWWRVLLDEAQMVESKTSKVASLVRMIPAIHRWAVTGTPIQNSLNDLQPLLQFIGFEAASEPYVWQQIVSDFVHQHEQQLENNNAIASTCPAMIDILQKCMWRTCKTQITSELNIPPQEEIVHRIQFDNLEKLFYNEQHEECRNKFLENVHKYSKRMTAISPQVMNIILQPFLKIRQTCSIPVVVATSNVNRNNNFNSQQQKQFLQPQELHDYLKSTNEISCKSELRAMASSHNGLAALYFLQKKYDEAIKNYKAVLKLANDYSDMNIAVDSLLQIHALHNLMQIKIIQSNISKINLEKYEKQYNQLEWKYLSAYASTLTTVKSGYEAAVDKLSAEISENFIITMADGLETLSSNDESILLQKIHEECMPKFGQTNVKLVEIQSSRSLLYVIQLWFNKLRDISKTLQTEIEDLNYFSENVRARNQVSPAIWRNIMHLVNSVYDCHLSEIREVQKSKKDIEKQKKTPKKKILCKLCSIRNSMNAFECLLFDKVIDKETNDTEGLENPSFEMYLCKLTFHFIKNKHRILINIMEKCWLYLENMQLFCKRLIKFWIEMEYTIKAYDELNMCKMRITLTDDAEDKSIFKIMENEIEGRLLEQQNELVNAQHQFTIKLARLRYIKHLEGNDDPGPCPICRLTEDDRYAVLECGHHICFPCLKSIRLYVKGSHFKCSICRNLQQNQKIYYVSRSKTKSIDSEIIIKGNYSSKITYIVRLIFKLQREKIEALQEKQSDSTIDEEAKENNVKILIFSQWEPIIQAIALALNENNIKYRAQCTPKTIEEFKNPSLGITCLLMPFVRGSKGLNLVEATHVFLVEPILNPGEELQAIGRVHRFGQHRQTTVHRFIVQESIEEKIYNFIISSSSTSSDATGLQRKWEFDNITLKDFENLFTLENGECD